MNSISNHLRMHLCKIKNTSIVLSNQYIGLNKVGSVIFIVLQIRYFFNVKNDILLQNIIFYFINEVRNIDNRTLVLNVQNTYNNFFRLEKIDFFFLVNVKNNLLKDEI